ncbi:MAG TPA: aminoacyl-tRNA hydrolase [Candidatus Paceibacterota bacterium]|nr:aminoacyl-tRNA hydrolase [Candidatus Paceibacterota bacterium]
MKFIVGLGNPSDEYVGTRHNIGRDIVVSFGRKFDFSEFEYNKKICASISEGKIGKEKVMLILPDTYMNKSGLSLKKFITSKKKALDLVVVHDDLDMGFGTQKIVFNRSSGGHRGVESVIKSIKTTEFPRIKIGISPVTASGKIKKPKGDRDVVKHVLGKFGKRDSDLVKKINKKTIDSLESIVSEGYVLAMNHFN